MRGTVRARTAEETWAVLEPQLGRYGITRVADLTGLDCLGIPVWTAIRPGAVTLSASQGKGATGRLAAVSAVMEALELWHVEQPLRASWLGTAGEVGAPWPLTELSCRVRHGGLEAVTLPWAAGTGLIDGGAVPVPVGLVERRRPRLWEPALFRATSTGVACGNTWAEAVLHGLYEVVERHTLHADEQLGGTARRWFDPGTVVDSYAGSLIGRITGAGAVLETAWVVSPYGLPVCLAYLWSEDYPLWFAGSGCHHDPHVALARAVTEAAQSRLTCIAGTRDDLPSREDVFDAVAVRPRPKRAAARWDDVLVEYTPGPGGTFEEQAGHVAEVVRGVTGWEPVAVDLARPDTAFAVVKVIAPGATSRTRRSIPR
ncbi:YcaO-like family protein [Streptomyces sp. NBC_00670]|jgi:ribosomal protein S12 methylthiotransferase accessory factor|uniref:YcaO-like family protein n=1 Tax=Streptomyces sp. NBC_00670 TaxID=2975804 RepID=UPI002E37BE45|nr:YcaO-like family protein [Streptomyces sp. NBC_00670]